MASAPEIELEAAQGATRSVALHRGMGDIIANREADIVDELVLAWRAGKATHEFLVAKIASISELRWLEGTLENNARKAIERVSVGAPA